MFGKIISLAKDVYNTFGIKILPLLIVMVLSGLVEGLGMSLLLPFLNTLGIGDVGVNKIGSHLTNLFGASGLTTGNVFGIVILIFVLQTILVISQSWLSGKIEAMYATDWRERLLETYLGGSWSFVANKKTGELVHMISVDAERTARALYLLIELLSTTVITLVYFSVALYISWKFTLFMVVVLVIVGAIVTSLSYKKSYVAGKDYSKFLGNVQAMLTDFLAGIKIIKATVTENKVLKKTKIVLKEVEKSSAKIVFISGTLKATIEIIAIILFCSLLIVGPKLFWVTPDVILVLIAIFFRLMQRMHHAQFGIQLLATYLPSLHNKQQLIENARKYQEVEKGGQSLLGNGSKFSIEVVNLSMSYDGVNALKKVSFDIPLGTKLAIVGSSGAGKSSLVNCLLGLSQFESGDILINGVSIKRIPIRAWRSIVGYVDQEVVLFNTSIRENILWATDNINDAKMVEAAKKAHIHNYIIGLPEGYDTVVGDRGVRLSGGQRQRIALARAFATDPLLLILDEATSSLDSRSERDVLRAIDDLQGNVSVVTVAHRLSTLKQADNIIVLDEGEIAEHGSWEGLIQNKGKFNKMWEIQSQL